jgi:hypothetical protein
MADSQNKYTLQLSIEHSRQGSYFTLPFNMPAGTAALSLAYHYERHHESQSPAGSGTFFSRQEINIIDLGLIAPDGTQVGASGSDKKQIYLDEVRATPGYRPRLMTPGEWQILVGAYKVAPEGVQVTYELEFTPKKLRLLKGDLHTHTVGSDGVLTAEELSWHAKRNGLDFVAITDHNQVSTRDTLPEIPGITLIPAVEWTHYQGHANFLGVDRPYDTSFATYTLEEAQARFISARERGALITVNHPFEGGCEFAFDLTSLPFDCLEIWNGPMRESNLKAIGLWQNLLASGKKIPACGGSDYHRDTPFIFLGGPTTGVYTLSTNPSDILDAVKKGHSFLTFSPHGPTLEMVTGEAMLGDSVRWGETREIQITVHGLLAGDVVRVVTGKGSTAILQAPTPGSFQGSYNMDAPGFARVEVLRGFLPGLPLLPALISNPIYFDEYNN